MSLWLIQAFNKKGPCCSRREKKEEVQRNHVSLHDREHAEHVIIEYIKDWSGEETEHSDRVLLILARLSMINKSMRVEKIECGCGDFLLIDKVSANSELNSYRDDKLIVNRLFTISEEMGISGKEDLIKDLKEISLSDEDELELIKWLEELRKEKGLPEFDDDESS